MSNEKYIKSPFDGNLYCVVNGKFKRHLTENNTTFKEYWESYVTGVTPICPFCLAEVQFQQGQRTYSNTCGKKECKNKAISETKQNWTNEQRLLDSDNKKKAFKAKTPAEIASIQQTRKDTCLEKYGVEYTTQTKQMKAATARTKLERYGDEFYNNSEQSSEKNRNKTVSEQDAINAKRRETNVELYGVECCYLMPEVVSKSMKTQALGKQYITPSGQVLHIRGYEPHVLDELYALYDEDDIYVDDTFAERNDKIIIEYKNVHEYTNKYYPDIYIKSKNLLIEVKSWWWYNGNGDPKWQGRFINNCRKAQASRAAGYNHEFWVYDNKTMEKTVI